MDWSSVITAFIGLGGTLGGGLITYLMVGRKAKTQIELDGATFDRKQIITTDQWLTREKEWKDDLQSQRDFYEKKLEEQTKYYQTKLDEKDRQIDILTRENMSQKEEMRELRHSVRDLQQVNKTSDEMKTAYVDTLKKQ